MLQRLHQQHTQMLPGQQPADRWHRILQLTSTHKAPATAVLEGALVQLDSKRQLTGWPQPLSYISCWPSTGLPGQYQFILQPVPCDKTLTQTLRLRVIAGTVSCCGCGAMASKGGCNVSCRGSTTFSNLIRVVQGIMSTRFCQGGHTASGHHVHGGFEQWHAAPYWLQMQPVSRLKEVQAHAIHEQCTMLLSQGLAGR